MGQKHQAKDNKPKHTLLYNLKEFILLLVPQLWQNFHLWSLNMIFPLLILDFKKCTTFSPFGCICREHVTENFTYSSCDTSYRVIRSWSLYQWYHCTPGACTNSSIFQKISHQCHQIPDLQHHGSIHPPSIPDLQHHTTCSAVARQFQLQIP